MFAVERAKPAVKAQEIADTWVIVAASGVNVAGTSVIAHHFWAVLVPLVGRMPAEGGKSESKESFAPH